MVAFLGQISVAAQSWANDFPQLGHRPPGTERACEDLTVEAVEARAVPFFMGVPTVLQNAFEALAMDVESDEESEAPTELGEEARAAKKARKAVRKAARKEKVNDCRKVMAKFGKSPG